MVLTELFAIGGLLDCSAVGRW